MEKGKESVFRKIWKFLWESESVWGWIADLLIAFAIVKFVIFPLLNIIFATSLPLVIVESTSMLHKNSFEEFWARNSDFYGDFNITLSDFEKFPFKNGFDKGDIMLIRGQKDYNIGDVIVFRVPGLTTPIIHRIIMKDTSNPAFTKYSTKGDNNAYQLVYEKSILPSQIAGKAIGQVPKLGWIKLIAVKPFQQS